MDLNNYLQSFEKGRQVFLLSRDGFTINGILNEFDFNSDYIKLENVQINKVHNVNPLIIPKVSISGWGMTMLQ